VYKVHGSAFFSALSSIVDVPILNSLQHVFNRLSLQLAPEQLLWELSSLVDSLL
jgi:hypothetical protein